MSTLQQGKQFYINGAWVNPQQGKDFEVIDPSTEKPFAVIALGNETDVNAAVAAAKAAFPAWSATDPKERLAYVEKILEIYKKRFNEMAETMSREVGCALDMSLGAQTASGQYHIENFINAFKQFEFVQPLVTQDSGGRLKYDSMGVVGLITPWNWPMNQITLKVIPALLAGCTMILKPSEITPMSALLWSEFMHEAGLPAGVYNLINGEGATVGTALSGHKDVEMISFTGSTRAGRLITQNAAETMKRVCLELGGKGANIIFADADEAAVERGLLHCYNNSGQNCEAPSRMLVERSYYEKAIAIVKQVAENVKLGKPLEKGDHFGPVVSHIQYDKIQALIQSGIDEGARLVCGGTGKPQGFETGYYVRPTVFADVAPQMRIFREEIFGPVLSIIPFDSEEEAIALANDTDYGLTNYVQTQDLERARRVASALRSGMVEINGNGLPAGCFFGGVKHSGRAREGGLWGIEEYLDTKAICGWE